MEKFECGDCGCFYWVEDRSNFDCPNCDQTEINLNQITMKVKELIKQLQEIENKNKYIHLLGNLENPENEDSDIIFENVEVWDDADESITLFISRGK